MNAKEILNLLAVKHSNDIFVPECKDGSTWFSAHKRLDAWVMPRSWVNLKFIGYEIKVSRSDFLKDDKYQEYMKLCNEFYFVIDNGVCDKNEVPAEAGLLQVSKTGSRLFIKKKAAFREIEFPKDLFLYILMSRATIRNNERVTTDNKEYWQTWLNSKSEKKTIGRAVSKRLRQLYEENIEKVRSENDEFMQKIKNYDAFKELLAKIGITDEDSYWNARDKITELRDQADIERLQSTLRDYTNEFNRTMDRINSNLDVLKSC